MIDRIKQEFYTVWQTEHESGKFEIPETSAEQMAKIKDTTCRILSKLQEIQKLSDNFVNENWIGNTLKIFRFKKLEILEVSQSTFTFHSVTTVR